MFEMIIFWAIFRLAALLSDLPQRRVNGGILFFLLPVHPPIVSIFSPLPGVPLVHPEQREDESPNEEVDAALEAALAPGIEEDVDSDAGKPDVVTD